MAKQKLSWWAPRWSYVPKLRHEWQQLCRPASVGRVTVICFLAGTAVVVGCKLAFPLLQLDFLWRAIVAIPSLYFFLAGLLLAYVVLPPRVEVRPDRILISHGQVVRRVNASSVISTRIVIFSADKTRLRITYSDKSRRRSRTIGVSRTIDLNELYDLLPGPPSVRDCRRRARFIDSFPLT